MGQDFTDLCPRLDRPPGGGDNYLQPVQVNGSIELVTRNLPPEVEEILLSTCTLFWNTVLIFFYRFLVLVTRAM